MAHKSVEEDPEDDEGAVVGRVVGAVEGFVVGFVVGAAVAGLEVGAEVAVAPEEGLVVGAVVGLVVGAEVAVTPEDGLDVGLVVGAEVAGLDDPDPKIAPVSSTASGTRLLAWTVTITPEEEVNLKVKGATNCLLVAATAQYPQSLLRVRGE